MNWKFYSAKEFNRFVDAWEKVRERSGHNGLMHADFIIPLVSEFGTGKEILAIAEDKNDIIAMAFLANKGKGVWETFQPSQSPLGVWMHDSNVSFDQLLPSLLNSLPGFALAVAVTQQDADIVPFKSQPSSLQYLDYIKTARVSVSSSFEEYWNQRGKNLRQNVKKQKNALLKENTIFKLDIISSPNDIPAALNDYARLESAGWKADRGTAIKDDNDQGRFYTEMLSRFARRGNARIYRYLFNDKVVAIDLCIVHGTELIVLKTTYDESIRSVSPATLLRHDYFQTIFDEKQISRIEFYGKVMDWHTKWTDEIRDIYHVNYFRWQWLPRLKQLLSRAPSAAIEKEEPIR